MKAGLVRRYSTKKVKIYTRTGDQGMTSLFNGERRRKDETIFQALGATDELSASLGIARAVLGGPHPIPDHLPIIQSRLLDIGSCIATPLHSTEKRLERVSFDSVHVDILEAWIDEIDDDLPPLKNFILPTGYAPSHIHLSRAICRKAERYTTHLVLEDAVDPVCSKYLNRLSDYLFTAARATARYHDIEETTYKKA